MPTITIYKIYGFFRRLTLIDRWSLMFSTRKENVKEHSWDVAAIAHTLCVISNKFFAGLEDPFGIGLLDPAKAAAYGLFHDASEAITGDMPTPVKYFSKEVKSASDKVEALAINKIVNCLPAEMRSAYEEVLNIPSEYKRIVKAADRIAALAKCLEEKKRGNDEFDRAEMRLRQILGESKEDMPEVGYFLDHFLPGFQMPLDALCEGNGSWIIDSDDVVVS
jgi:5'-deoxynucleotidase